MAKHRNTPTSRGVREGSGRLREPTLEEEGSAALNHLHSALIELAHLAGRVSHEGIVPSGSVGWALYLHARIVERMIDADTEYRTLHAEQRP